MRESSAQASACILLIEDNETDVVIAREAVKQSKLLNKLYVVNNGQEALDFIYQQGKHKYAPRPGLVLLDLNMPGLGGIEVLKKIKSDPDKNTIPIVVLTVSRAEEDIQRAYALHANCYISKPLNFERFTEIVRSIGQFWLEIVTLPPKENIDSNASDTVNPES